MNPFAAQIATKVLMMGYVIVQYRLVPGEQLGNYLLAALIFTYASTIADWGLSTLMTRDIARVRGSEDEVGLASRLFQNTLALRLTISLAMFVPVALLTAVYVIFFGFGISGAWAVLLLTISLLPGAFSASVTALLYAYERMTLPAAIGIGTSFLNVALGVGALLLGWGVIGLATASLGATLATTIIFWRIL